MKAVSIFIFLFVMNSSFLLKGINLWTVSECFYEDNKYQKLEKRYRVCFYDAQLAHTTELFKGQMLLFNGTAACS